MKLFNHNKKSWEYDGYKFYLKVWEVNAHVYLRVQYKDEKYIDIGVLDDGSYYVNHVNNYRTVETAVNAACEQILQELKASSPYRQAANNLKVFVQDIKVN